MIFMKRWFNILSLIILFVFFVPETFAQEKIGQYIIDIEIKDSGKIDVREKITYDFGVEERHGIFRDLPFIKTNSDGKKFKISFENFQVLNDSGQPYSFTESTEGENIRLKIGDPDKTITGVHAYNIFYTARGALTYFSDHDELYFNAIGNSSTGGWEVPIEKATVTVTAPPGDGSYNFDCFTRYSGSTEKDCIVSQTSNKATITLNRPLEAGEGPTVVAGFPINLVSRLEPEPLIGFFDTLFGKLTLVALIFLGIWWYLIYPLWIVAKWFLYGRDPVVGAALTAFFEPPTHQSGKLKPGEAGVLVDEIVHSRDVAATMVDLARRGWFTISEKAKGEIELKKYDKKTEETLADFEKKLFDSLFDGGKRVNLEDIELYTAVKEVEKMLYENVVEYGFFKKNPQSIRTFYSVIGTIALTTLSLPLAVSAFIFGRSMPARTFSGAIETGKTRGLKNFLKSQEKLIEFQSKQAGTDLEKQNFFEELLPFAIAFGVEKEWVKHFASLDVKPPQWFTTYRTGVFVDSFGKSLDQSLSDFRSSATPTSSSSGFSSGFSSGSSGGGGGGGGGGSW